MYFYLQTDDRADDYFVVTMKISKMQKVDITQSDDGEQMKRNVSHLELWFIWLYTSDLYCIIDIFNRAKQTRTSPTRERQTRNVNSIADYATPQLPS